MENKRRRGRPTKSDDERRIQFEISLPPTKIALLDELRGAISKSQYIECLLDAQAKRNKTVTK